MKTVYQCEFCDTVVDDEKIMIEHEKVCGKNPNNTIKDEMVIKLSRMNDRFISSLIYVLCEDYYKNLEFYNDEFERATTRNCPASVFEERKEMTNLIFKCHCTKKASDYNYFRKITLRDNLELIQAIRTSLKEPEFRV